MTSSICEPLAIVTSHWSIILTLYLCTLSSSQWRCQPECLSMAAHCHDRRGIYRCALLSFCGRIEIDHSYGLRCRGLCCHSRPSTRGAGRKQTRNGRLHSCCARSVSTNHSSADRIVVNSYIIAQVLELVYTPPFCSNWHEEGHHEYQLKMLACDQEHCTPATAIQTTTTNVVNDTSNRKGIKTLI